MVTQSYMTQVAPSYHVLEGTPQLPTLFKIANVNEDVVRNAVNLGGNLTAATAMARNIDMRGYAIAAPGLAGKIAEGAMQAMISQPNAKDLLVGDVQRDLADLRIRVDEAETRDENINDYIDDRIDFRAILLRDDRANHRGENAVVAVALNTAGGGDLVLCRFIRRGRMNSLSVNKE